MLSRGIASTTPAMVAQEYINNIIIFINMLKFKMCLPSLKYFDFISDHRLCLPCL